MHAPICQDKDVGACSNGDDRIFYQVDADSHKVFGAGCSSADPAAGADTDTVETEGQHP